MLKLPRANDDRVVLSGDVYNRIADELERLANIDVVAPLEMSESGAGLSLSVRALPSAVKWGTVVCNGPDGESDFVDNRYWVQRCTFGAGSPVTLATIDPGLSGYEIVEATNLFEDNCHTHFVRPGTPVAYWDEFDGSTPPQLQHVMLVADEGVCRSKPCSGSSSSSSSSSSSGSESGSSSVTFSSSSGTSSGSGNSTSSSSGVVCIYEFAVDYDCASQTFDAVRQNRAFCNVVDPGQAIGVWEVFSQGSSACTYVIQFTGAACETNADCTDWPATPAPPSDGSDCSCGSSSSGSLSESGSTSSGSSAESESSSASSGSSSSSATSCPAGFAMGTVITGITGASCNADGSITINYTTAQACIMSS